MQLLMRNQYRYFKTYTYIHKHYCIYLFVFGVVTLAIAPYITLLVTK